MHWWSKKTEQVQSRPVAKPVVRPVEPPAVTQEIANTSPKEIEVLPVVTANKPNAVISKNVDIPPGLDVSVQIGFPADLAATVAVIANQAHPVGREDVVTLLCDQSIFMSPSMFDARRRIDRMGVVVDKVMSCTAEIIKTIKDRPRDGGQKISAGAPNATSIELKISAMISKAVSSGTSDIHIETRGGHADVFFRVNGTRVFHDSYSKETASQMGTVLYTVYADASSKEVSWDPAQSMDGAIDYQTADGKSVQLRFASSPIHPTGNFQIVMRVLVMDAGSGRNLQQMGYEAQQIRAFETMVTGSNGMVLLCGPTNSGKSTSMQELTRIIFRRRGALIKVITVEDPVEYIIPAACQIGVSSKKKGVGATPGSVGPFAQFLKATLRMDPDVVVVGEIRDGESADVVKDLVLAGRKLLTTLHAYSALWAFVRLREIGVPNSLLTMPGFISGIVYQRLVATLCQQCSLPITSPEARGRIPADVFNRVTHVVDLGEHNVRVKGDGCPACNHSGVSGRTVVAEFVVPDQQLLRLIADDKNIEAYEYWRNAGVLKIDDIGVTALSHAIHKMRKGLIDPMEVETQVNILTNDMVMADSILMAEEMDNVILGDTGYAHPVRD